MRRTISTLMFLAVGGLAFAAHAQNSTSGSSSYYAAGSSTYRISDEDDEQPAASTAKTHTTGVATAVGQPNQPGQEKNALYVSDKASGLSGQLLQTNYFEAASPSCGAGNACGCNGGCNGGCNSCNNNCGCLSDCCNCDCAINTFRFEYLAWFSRGRNTPALVTTSPGGTLRADAGILGLADTTVLYGDDPIGTNIRSGGRLTFSHLFNDGITYGDVRFWGLEDGSETFTADDSGTTSIIGIPFLDRTPGINVENAFLVAFPNFSGAPGSIRVLSKNDLIGADAWLRRSWYDDGCLAVDILGGYQFTRLDDSVVLAADTVAGPDNALPAGTTLSIFDSFRTQNEFHGASLGFIARSDRGAVTLEGLFKVGMGNMRQRVVIDGSTTLNGTSTTPGGIFAQPTNIGSFERNRFAFSPELNLNVVYNVNESWRLLGGYSFVYWNDVVLAGNQIDRNVNTTQFAGGGLTGVALPGVKFQKTDFWVQGISTGAEYRW
jgi:hypothetical protein